MIGTLDGQEEGSMANPMYRQIAEDLREQIESGELAPGQQLQTELELREHYEASRNTVRDAIKWLTTLGLVETRPGQGTFVVQKIDPFITTLTGDPRPARRREDTRYLSEVRAGTGSRTSARSRLRSRKPLTMWRTTLQKPGHGGHQPARTRFIDGIPGRCGRRITRWISRTAERNGSGAPADIEEGTVQYLADTLRIHQWVTGTGSPCGRRTPTKRSSSNCLRRPVPMYEISRTAYDGNGQPMRLTVTVYPADRNQFVVDVGTVPELQRGAGTSQQ